MSNDVNEWIQLILRWTHVFAGILWVGTTYYFTWLDGRFAELGAVSKQEIDPSPQPSPHQMGRGSEEASPDLMRRDQVWMVHSGGFYLVQRQKSPKVMPGKLHWFRWEAAITWLSGFLLFA